MGKKGRPNARRRAGLKIQLKRAKAEAAKAKAETTVTTSTEPTATVSSSTETTVSTSSGTTVSASTPTRTTVSSSSLGQAYLAQLSLLIDRGVQKLIEKGDMHMAMAEQRNQQMVRRNVTIETEVDKTSKKGDIQDFERVRQLVDASLNQDFEEEKKKENWPLPVDLYYDFDLAVHGSQNLNEAPRENQDDDH